MVEMLLNQILTYLRELMSFKLEVISRLDIIERRIINTKEKCNDIDSSVNGIDNKIDIMEMNKKLFENQQEHIRNKINDLASDQKISNNKIMNKLISLN